MQSDLQSLFFILFKRKVINVDKVSYKDVKHARQTRGITQKAMSEYFGIPVRTISDWERGLRNPPEWTCRLLINAINQLGKEED